jgi:hypothetical protein
MITWLVLVLTLLNLLVFFFRDRFQYQPYGGDEELYGPCDTSCYNTWKEYATDFPRQELKEARMITDSVLAGQPDETISKIRGIGHFLYNRFHDQLGTPPPSLLSHSPMNQYRELSLSDTLELWCGNFAEIFTFFCWSQDITARTIEIMNPGDHHVLNECYLPEENRWIMVDLTNNLIVVRDKEGRALDLIRFYQTLESGNPARAEIVTKDSKRLETLDISTGSGVPHYYLDRRPLYYYHRVAHEHVYDWREKLRRYVLPVSWYDIYEEEGRSNLLFYIKDLLIGLWLISLIIFMVTRKK